MRFAKNSTLIKTISNTFWSNKQTMNPQITVVKSYENSSLVEEIEGRVLKIVEKNVDFQISATDKEKTFKQMGVDSLSVVDMVVEMEQSIGIDITN